MPCTADSGFHTTWQFLNILSEESSIEIPFNPFIIAMQPAVLLVLEDPNSPKPDTFLCSPSEEPYIIGHPHVESAREAMEVYIPNPVNPIPCVMVPLVSPFREAPLSLDSRHRAAARGSDCDSASVPMKSAASRIDGETRLFRALSRDCRTHMYIYIYVCMYVGR